MPRPENPPSTQGEYVDTRSNYRIMKDSGFDSNYDMMHAYGLKMYNVDDYSEFKQILQAFRYRDAQEEAAARAAADSAARCAAGRGDPRTPQGARWSSAAGVGGGSAPGAARGSQAALYRGSPPYGASSTGAPAASQRCGQRGIASSYDEPLRGVEADADGGRRAYDDGGGYAAIGRDSRGDNDGGSNYGRYVDDGGGSKYGGYVDEDDDGGHDAYGYHGSGPDAYGYHGSGPDATGYDGGGPDATGYDGGGPGATGYDGGEHDATGHDGEDDDGGYNGGYDDGDYDGGDYDDEGDYNDDGDYDDDDYEYY